MKNMLIASMFSFGLLLNISLMGGTITYVDAVEGAAGNTFATGGSLANTTWIATSSKEDQWFKRTDYGNGGDIYQASHNVDNGDDMPELTTQITGLADGTYNIWVFFWDSNNAGQSWTIDAGLTSGDLTLYDAGEVAAGIDGVPASTLMFLNTVATTESGGALTLWGAYLGQAAVSGGSAVNVFIHNTIGNTGVNRTWYDGVGYSLVSPVALSNTKFSTNSVPSGTLVGQLTYGNSVGDDDFVFAGGTHDELFEIIKIGATVSELRALVLLGTGSYTVRVAADNNSGATDVHEFVITLRPPFPGNSSKVVPDGTWSWFTDERAIFHQGHLYASYVRGDGKYGISRYNPKTGDASEMILSTAASQQANPDDHNYASITVLPDQRLLAVYQEHGTEKKFYYRISSVATPSVDADWGSEQVKSTASNTTYANTYTLSTEPGFVYNFHRDIGWDPTLTLSADNGMTWGGQYLVIDAGDSGQRPYTRFFSKGIDRIDFTYTDGHPDSVNNSLYHLYYQSGAGLTNGNFKLSNGTVLKSLAEMIAGDAIDHDGDQPGASGAERGSVVYQYSGSNWGVGEGPDDWIPGGRAWNWDGAYDRSGNPVVAFQSQQDNVTGTGWNHARIYYYYALWTGSEWRKRCIAQGGRGFYSAAADYAGGMAIDPDHPEVVYISSNAEAPFDLTHNGVNKITNSALKANDRYELYRGVTADGGLTFAWEQITVDSEEDNLRPVVPADHGYGRAVLWLNGRYTTYNNFNTRILAILEKPRVYGTVIVIQ